MAGQGDEYAVQPAEKAAALRNVRVLRFSHFLPLLATLGDVKVCGRALGRA